MLPTSTISVGHRISLVCSGSDSNYSGDSCFGSVLGYLACMTHGIFSAARLKDVGQSGRVGC